jgi:hypothetical protein
MLIHYGKSGDFVHMETVIKFTRFMLYVKS